jgi:hypothetical protein
MPRTTYPKILKKYPSREDFVRELRKIKPGVTIKTLRNAWYDTRGPKNIVRVDGDDYKKLYDKYPNRVDFIREVQKKYKTLILKTISNRWNLYNRKKNPIISYAELYVKYPEREAFIREASSVRVGIQINSIIRRWQELKQKSKGLIIGSKTIKYSNDDKRQPSDYKMLEFKDIVRFNKPRTREYLLRYGFTTNEVNWLDEEGMLDGMVQKEHNDENQ